MHCCACSGFCHHVGGPFYCNPHSALAAPQPIPPTTVNFPSVWSAPTMKNDPCELGHCCCIPVEVAGKKYKRCHRCAHHEDVPKAVPSGEAF